MKIFISLLSMKAITFSLFILTSLIRLPSISAQTPGIVQFVLTEVAEPSDVENLRLLFSAQAGVNFVRADFFTRNVVLLVDDHLVYDEMTIRAIIHPTGMGFDCYQAALYNNEPIIPISARICERQDY